MRAVYWDGRQRRAVDVAPWVTFAARLGADGRYEVTARCTVCGAPPAQWSGALPQADLQRMAGDFALAHDECARDEHDVAQRPNGARR